MMRKRWLSILALALMAVGCCALGACNGGEQGPQGEPGKDGKSAYQIWLDNGNTGTEADFLNWLKGEKGDQGEQGEKGDKGDQGDASAQTQESLRFQKISGKEEYRVMGMGTVSSLDVVIPETYQGLPVTEIGAYAFEQESYIESITIPNSVNSIDNSAFSGCSSLTEMTLPFVGDRKDGSSYTYFGYFFGASSYSYNTRYIPTSLKKVTITGGSIGDDAFYKCSSLTSVVIGDDVTSIGVSAFWNCNNLTSVVIGNGVTTIGDDAFSGCSSLVYNVKDGLKYLGNSNNPYLYLADTENTSITMANIDVNCRFIGSFAFYECSSLTSVTIPDSVTSIGADAFRDCYKLVEVVNKSSSITITKGSFENGYIGYYALAVYNSGDIFTGIKFSNDNGYIVYTDGEEKILVRYEGTETDLVLPSYITKIYQYAFYKCSSLTSVEIPDNGNRIGDGAFSGCSSLTSVVIPEGVITLGENAFYGCSSLTSVYRKDTEWEGDSITIIFGGNSDFTSAKSYFYDESETAKSWWHYDKNGNVVHA